MHQSLGDRRTFRPGLLLWPVIFVALCIPMYTVCDSEYAPETVLTNVFGAIFLVGAVFSRRLDWKRRNVFGYALLALLVLANVLGLYYNWMYHRWYAGQFHYSVSFLTFIALCFFREGEPAEDGGVVRFLLGTILVSNAAAIVVRMLGYYRIDFMNNQVYGFTEPVGGYPWIYLHKSQFSFALVLFLALFTIYRSYFRQKWLFWLGIGVLVVDLILADTYTSMAAALCIPGGVLLDRLLAKRRFRLRYLLWLIPIALVCLLLFFAISSNRNVATLGNRTNIWGNALRLVLGHPEGFGVQAGMFCFQDYGYDVYAFNCHNVFLNWMLQLSIPVGLCYIVLFFTIVAVSIQRNPSFTTLGIWVALLLPMHMDWCVLPTEMTMTMLCIYLLFFSPLRKGIAPKEKT